MFEPSRGSDTPLTRALNNPRFLYRPSIHYAPELFKVALEVVVAAKRALDGLEDLTEQTTAQSGFYTHRGLDEQASSIRPPP